MESSFVDKTVRLPTGKLVSFDSPIGQALQIGQVTVVRLVSRSPQNVFAIGPDGTLLWRAEVTETHSGKTPYHEIWRSEDTVVLANVDKYLVVNPTTGEIVRRYAEK